MGIYTLNLIYQGQTIIYIFQKICLLYFLQLFQALDVGYAHSAVLVFPVVKGLLSNAKLADDFSRWSAVLVLIQDLLGYDLRCSFFIS